MNVLVMSKRYNRTPSEILSIKDEYTSYCFNEACAYILGRLESGEEMQVKRQYGSFSDIYAQYE